MDGGIPGDQADGQIAKARIRGERGEEGFDRARPEPVPDDEAVDIAGIEVARGILHAERADQADPRADRGGKCRIGPAAAGDQHGRFLQRVERRQLRNVGAVAAQGVDPAQHRRMEGTHPQRGGDPADDLFDACSGVDRQHVEHGRPAAFHARDHRHERRRRGVDGSDEFVEDRSGRGEVGIGEHHGRRPELADRGRRIRQLAFDHRKRAGSGKAGHQLAVLVIGNDENRAWKRHVLLGFPRA